MPPRAEARGELPRAAIRYLRSKRRRPSRHWTDVWREEHATAFTVAQMTRATLLEEVHGELVKALGEGTTLETFRSRLKPWLEQRGWAPGGRGGDVATRLERIYNTNLRTAHAAGQWDRISRAAELLPYLIYERSVSPEPRAEHLAWVGICLPVDDPWWSTHYPPNGWGCKCRVRQVAKPPKGSVTKAPPTRTTEWANPATGEVRRVARGIDPGWDYHIGAVRTAGVNSAWLRRMERVTERLGAGAAAPMLERHLAGPGFRWFVERPRSAQRARWEARGDLIEATPVGILPAQAAETMGAAGPVVRLTERVMHEQVARRAALPAELYARIPELLSAAAVRDEATAAGQRWRFQRRVDAAGEARTVRLVVEVPSRGKQPAVVSLAELED